MGDVERRWTLLISRSSGEILRSRLGERDLPAVLDGTERVVVVPASQLEGAIAALTDDEVDGLHSAINAAVHHGVLTGERVDALRARVDSLGGRYAAGFRKERNDA